MKKIIIEASKVIIAVLAMDCIPIIDNSNMQESQRFFYCIGFYLCVSVIVDIAIGIVIALFSNKDKLKTYQTEKKQNKKELQNEPTA